MESYSFSLAYRSYLLMLDYSNASGKEKLPLALVVAG
jgi:hypothetical protein